MNLPQPRTAKAGPPAPNALSVCCATRVSPPQTRASLAPLRGVAAEIVVGLDARLAERASEYEEFADRVIVLPCGVVERDLAELHRACTQEWVLRVDDDETVSPALLAELPALLADGVVRRYAIARRWVVDDGARWVDEAPWWPDFRVRLIRPGDDPLAGRPPEAELPPTFVAEPLLHLDCLPQTALERQARALGHAVERPGGPGTLREPCVQRFEPERSTRRPPVPLAGEEQAAVRAFLRASGTGITRWAPWTAVDPPGAASPGPAATDPQGDEAAWELLERDFRFETGVDRTVYARVTNLSERTWEPGARRGEAGLFAGYRWRWPDGSELEGVRTPFAVALRPGDARVVRIEVAPPHRPGPVWLDLGVVDEHVRWLSGQQRVDALLDAPAPLPLRREVRPPPRSRRWRRRAAPAAAIPRVLHRIWLGDAPMPPAHVRYGETWQDLHPAWDFRLWTDADAPTPPGVERARNVGERSDLVRYEILRRHGGVYVDTDVECLRPIDELLEGVTAFAAYEVPGRLCNAVIGAAPGHAAFTRATQLATVTVGRGTYPQATATAFLTYVLERLEDVTLFGPERFYPELWEGTKNVGDEAPYAAHHWARSWDADWSAARLPRGPRVESSQ